VVLEEQLDQEELAVLVLDERARHQDPFK